MIPGSLQAITRIQNPCDVRSYRSAGLFDTPRVGCLIAGEDTDAQGSMEIAKAEELINLESSCEDKHE
jgi:hypothetical protein